MEFVIAAIGIVSGGAGFWSWLSGRRREREAVLASRFDDASEFAQYVNDQIEKAVTPLRTELDSFKSLYTKTTSAFRLFFTQLWVWDRAGRAGEMPGVSTELMEELQLVHLIDMPKDPS